MTNFTAKILNNSVSALTAQQAVIATTANNISNVNTPGYARRTVELKTRGTLGQSGQLDVGNGVEIGQVQRVTDQFVEKLLREATTDNGAASTKNELLDRLQQIFGLTDSQSTIGTNLTQFFSAAEDLSSNPSSIELRGNFIAKANLLVDSIHSAYNSIAAIQTEADQRVINEVQNVNGLLDQIATLNGRIAARESGGQVASDERDQRQTVLNQLASKMNYSMLEQQDGSVTISLPDGFSLVNGTSVKALSATTNPSFVTSAPPSLGGQALTYITYDFSGGAGTQHIDLTQQITGGSIGGLLSVRGYADPTNTSAFQASGTTVELASRVESIARTLLTTVNQTYFGPDRDSGTAGVQSSAGDLNGTNPAVFGLFTFSGAPTTGVANPAALAATGLDNFSSRIQLAFSDPTRVAAARDASGGAPAAAVYPKGDGSNIKAIADLRDPTTPYTFSIGSYSFTGNFDSAYNEIVTKVGSDKARAELDTNIAAGNLQTAQNKRDEVSGVSLDEEFTNLVKFQKAYQAAARMIKVGQELLDEILRGL